MSIAPYVGESWMRFDMDKFNLCPYSEAISRAFDIHFDCMDCWLTDCPYPKNRAEWNRRTDNG